MVQKKGIEDWYKKEKVAQSVDKERCQYKFIDIKWDGNKGRRFKQIAIINNEQKANIETNFKTNLNYVF